MKSNYERNCFESCSLSAHILQPLYQRLFRLCEQNEHNFLYLLLEREKYNRVKKSCSFCSHTLKRLSVKGFAMSRIKKHLLTFRSFCSLWKGEKDSNANPSLPGINTFLWPIYIKRFTMQPFNAVYPLMTALSRLLLKCQVSWKVSNATAQNRGETWPQKP